MIRLVRLRGRCLPCSFSVLCLVCWHPRATYPTPLHYTVEEELTGTKASGHKQNTCGMNVQLIQSLVKVNVVHVILPTAIFGLFSFNNLQ